MQPPSSADQEQKDYNHPDSAQNSLTSANPGTSTRWRTSGPNGKEFGGCAKQQMIQRLSTPTEAGENQTTCSTTPQSVHTEQDQKEVSQQRTTGHASEASVAFEKFRKPLNCPKVSQRRQKSANAPHAHHTDKAGHVLRAMAAQDAESTEQNQEAVEGGQH